MAEPNTDPKAKAQAAARAALQAETLDRLEDARRQKAMMDVDLREGYFFTAPHRARMVSSRSPVPQWKPQDAVELNTSLGKEVSGDFPTVVLNTFMPQAEPWVKQRVVTAGLPDDVRKEAEAAAEEQSLAVFAAIGASNFYSEFGKGAKPDLALGTIGMWAEDPGRGEPVRCQAVPIRELEINLGADGQIDDRFVVRWTTYRRIKALIKKDRLPADLEEKIKNSPKKACCAIWAFWRLHDEAPTEKWQYVLMVDKTVIEDRTLKGDGSCPLWVGRFGASPEWAWASGPTIEAMEELRTVDELSAKKIKNVDNSVDPALAWPDDSFVNIEDGIENGKAYKVRPGTEDAIKNIYTPNSPEAAIFEMQDLEQRVKRLHYLDFPEQTGKTPPTLGQWLDEMTRAQQRIGTPGLTFWAEFCAYAFKRFRFILEKRGEITPIRVQGKRVSVMPFNPAQRAAEQQEVAQYAKFAQLGGGTQPEEFKMLTEGEGTLDNLASRLGVTKIWVKRKPQDAQAAIGNIKQLLGGQAPNAPAIPSQPAGGPANSAGEAPAGPQFDFRSLRA